MALQACLLWTGRRIWRIEPACWHKAKKVCPENKVQRGVTVIFNLLQPQVKASSAICQSHTRLVAALLHQMTLIRATAGPLPIFIKLLTNLALGPPQHDSLQKLHERQGPIRAMLLKRLQQQVVPVGARIVRLVSQELQ